MTNNVFKHVARQHSCVRTVTLLLNIAMVGTVCGQCFTRRAAAMRNHSAHDPCRDCDKEHKAHHMATAAWNGMTPVLTLNLTLTLPLLLCVAHVMSRTTMPMCCGTTCEMA